MKKGEKFGPIFFLFHFFSQKKNLKLKRNLFLLIEKSSVKVQRIAST